MKNKLITAFISFLFASVFSLSAQPINKKTKKLLQKQADAYMLEGNPASYLKAYSIFKRLKESYPSDEYYNALVAITGVYDDESRSFAKEKLNRLSNQARGDDNIDAWMTFSKYEAEAEMMDHNYKNAIDIYDRLLNVPDIEDEDRVVFLAKKQQASYALDMLEKAGNKDKMPSRLRSLSKVVNTKYDEYNPTLNIDASLLVYTYSGERSTGGKMDESFKPDNVGGDYYEDIFISRKKNDKWSQPSSIGNNINTKGHDASVSISPEGKKVLIFKSDFKNNGDIYSSTLEGDQWSRPRPVRGINTEYWEGSASIENGSKRIYFSSDRPGGFGGRDIYVANMDEEGRCSNVRNLGRGINTSYDEDAPFIFYDNKLLIFSSNNPKNSYGGYDAFMSKLQANGEWSEVINVGPPVSSPSDDKYFSISPDAKKGYLSSARTTNGYDLYTTDLSKNPLFKDVGVSVFRGAVFGDDLPLDADLTIIDEETGDVFGRYKSNGRTGLYLFALEPLKKYTLRVEQIGYETIEIMLDMSKAKVRSGKIEKNVFLYSKDFANERISEKEQNYEFKRLIRDVLGVEFNINELGVDNSSLMDDGELAEDNGKLTEEKSQKYKLIFDDNVASVTNKFITPTDPALYLSPDKVDVSFLRGVDLNKNKNYIALMQHARFVHIKGLIYKVQIAAYEKARNYKARKVKRYGNPEFAKLSDGVTRFTQGRFPIIADAEKFRNLIKKAGVFDSWITVHYNGKRYFLEDLVNVNFDIKELIGNKSRN